MARHNKKKPHRNFKRRELKPKTEGQEEYIKCVLKNDITFCDGPAGTGKTAVSVGLACQHLLDKKVEKIVITRPVIESGRGLGFLPGTFSEKIHPLAKGLIDSLSLLLVPTIPM